MITLQAQGSEVSCSQYLLRKGGDKVGEGAAKACSTKTKGNRTGRSVCLREKINQVTVIRSCETVGHPAAAVNIRMYIEAGEIFVTTIVMNSKRTSSLSYMLTG